MPRLIELLESLRRAFPQIPQVLVFETSFFVELPARERRYALDPELLQAKSCGATATTASCTTPRVCRRFATGNADCPASCRCAWNRAPNWPPAGRRPVMVTGGNTPIEGLPGETTCGDLDPSVVLKVAHDTHWGPEETSRILTSQSGLLGLTGQSLSLAELFTSAEERWQLPRDLFRHSLLRSLRRRDCGARRVGRHRVLWPSCGGRRVASRVARPAPGRALRFEPPHLIHTRSLCQLVRDSVRVMAAEVEG